MSSLENIKQKVQDLYNTNPNVHINVTLTNPRVCLENEPAEICGVYRHIFQIIERSSGSPKRHTLQYADVLTNRVQILELL